MKRVIDSSVAFKWVVPETHSDKALLIRDDFRNGLMELLAPDVFPIEVGHALSRAEQQGRIPLGSGIPLGRDILNTLPLLHPPRALLLRAVELSSQLRVGVYDCSPLPRTNNASSSPPTTSWSKTSNLISELSAALGIPQDGSMVKGACEHTPPVSAQCHGADFIGMAGEGPELVTALCIPQDGRLVL